MPEKLLILEFAHKRRREGLLVQFRDSFTLSEELHALEGMDYCR